MKETEVEMSQSYSLFSFCLNGNPSFGFWLLRILRLRKIEEDIGIKVELSRLLGI